MCAASVPVVPVCFDFGLGWWYCLFVLLCGLLLLGYWWVVFFSCLCLAVCGLTGWCSLVRLCLLWLVARLMVCFVCCFW